MASANSEAPRRETIVVVPLGAVKRRKLGRLFLWSFSWLTFAFLLLAPIVFHQMQLPGSEDILRVYAAVSIPAAALGLANWFHTRKTVLAVNRVAVGVNGLYPPFKPKPRLSRTDWFIPYREINSMQPAVERNGFVPAYDVTLKDGVTFQLNAMDILVYVDEKAVRRYAVMLQTIKQEIEKPDNRTRASRGEDIMIPLERFETASG